MALTCEANADLMVMGAVEHMDYHDISVLDPNTICISSCTPELEGMYYAVYRSLGQHVAPVGPRVLFSFAHGTPHPALWDQASLVVLEPYSTKDAYRVVIHLANLSTGVVHVNTLELPGQLVHSGMVDSRLVLTTDTNDVLWVNDRLTPAYIQVSQPVSSGYFGGSKVIKAVTSLDHRLVLLTPSGLTLYNPERWTSEVLSHTLTGPQDPCRYGLYPMQGYCLVVSPLGLGSFSVHSPTYTFHCDLPPLRANESIRDVYCSSVPDSSSHIHLLSRTAHQYTVWHWHSGAWVNTRTEPNSIANDYWVLTLYTAMGCVSSLKQQLFINPILSLDTVYTALRSIADRSNKVLPRFHARALEFVTEYLEDNAIDWQDLARTCTELFTGKLDTTAYCFSPGSAAVLKPGFISFRRDLDWAEFILLNKLENMGKVVQVYESVRQHNSEFIREFSSLCEGSFQRQGDLLTNLITLIDMNLDLLTGFLSIEASELDQLLDLLLQECSLASDTPPQVGLKNALFQAQSLREVVFSRFQLLCAVVCMLLTRTANQYRDSISSSERLQEILMSSYAGVLDLLRSYSLACYISGRGQGALLRNILKIEGRNDLSNVFPSATGEGFKIFRILTGALRSADFETIVVLCDRFHDFDARMGHFLGLAGFHTGDTDKASAGFHRVIDYFAGNPNDERSFEFFSDYFQNHGPEDTGPLPDLPLKDEYSLRAMLMFEHIEALDMARFFSTLLEGVWRRGIVKSIEFSVALQEYQGALDLIQTGRVPSEFLQGMLTLLLKAMISSGDIQLLSSLQWNEYAEPVRSILIDLTRTGEINREYFAARYSFELTRKDFLRACEVQLELALRFKHHSGSPEEISSAVACALNAMEISQEDSVTCYNEATQAPVRLSRLDLRKLYHTFHLLTTDCPTVQALCDKYLNNHEWSNLETVVLLFQDQLDVNAILKQLIEGCYAAKLTTKLPGLTRTAKRVTNAQCESMHWEFFKGIVTRLKNLDHRFLAKALDPELPLPRYLVSTSATRYNRCWDFIHILVDRGQLQEAYLFAKRIMEADPPEYVQFLPLQKLLTATKAEMAENPGSALKTDYEIVARFLLQSLKTQSTL